MDDLGAYRELPERPERGVRNVWPASPGDIRALRALTVHLVPPPVFCVVCREWFSIETCPTCGIRRREP